MRERLRFAAPLEDTERIQGMAQIIRRVGARRCADILPLDWSGLHHDARAFPVRMRCIVVVSTKANRDPFSQRGAVGDADHCRASACRSADELQESSHCA